MLVTLLIFLFSLSLLVIVHELGHFWAAKSIGVKVEKFAIGFPPKVWSKVIKGTEYKINALPLGGYVSLKGEEADETDSKNIDKDSLASRSPQEHLLVFVAGVLMNFLLGVLLLWISFSIGIQPILSDMPKYSGVIDTQRILIQEVEKETPADKEGLKKGDQIIKADGKEIRSSQEFISLVDSKLGQNGATVDLIIKRDGQELEKKIATYKSKVKGRGDQEVEVNRIGVVLDTEGKVKANPIDALKVAFLEAFRITKLTFVGIIGLFATLITKFQLSTEVSGPVGIYMATSYFANLGIGAYIQFLAVISFSLALFNILPIPALDGGQIFFTLVEMVSRRKFSNKVKAAIQTVGFALLITLILSVTVREIIKFNVLGNLFK